MKRPVNVALTKTSVEARLERIKEYTAREETETLSIRVYKHMLHTSIYNARANLGRVNKELVLVVAPRGEKFGIKKNLLTYVILILFHEQLSPIPQNNNLNK